MPVLRRNRSCRTLGFVSALLLSTAIAAPAFAQIEEVIVTAQKKTQDIQTVPIAISAFTSRDLKAHQIDRFKDLQFSTPNVSYTKGNFYGSDFQIRGIGVTAIGYDSENGVAINFNDVYLANPNIADNGFYDLQRIEVLRGPQSTLYGRTATGGVVSVIANKPMLDGFESDLSATYGNYDYTEVKGMVNIPIVTDQLGLRIAGDWVRHSGYTTNLYNGHHIDGRSQYSVRGTLRWQPTDKTTVDVTASFSNEADNKMRSQKMLCHNDPSGILGCLPDSAPPGGTDNPNAVLGTIASSVQGMHSAFDSTLGPALTAQLTPMFEAPPYSLPPATAAVYAQNAALATIGNLGLYDLSTSPTVAASPKGIRTVNTDFDPRYKAQDSFMSLEWKQTWSNWLESTFVGGYDREFIYSQESFISSPPTIDPLRLATAEGTLMSILTGAGGAAYAANFAPYMAAPFGALPAGTLPLSGTKNLGSIGGNFTTTNIASTYDQSNNSSTQWSGELRFNTKFDGPINAMIAAYYMSFHESSNYFVNSPLLDYPAIVLGAISGLSAPGLCGSTGCIYGPGFYNNNGDYNSLQSRSVYGEIYYTAIPDTLKFTVGARWTEDHKFQRGRIELLDGLIPIGSTDENAAMAQLAALGMKDFNVSNGTPPNDTWQLNSVTYRKWTGRFVADWTPKLDFTDATLIYASYARGYKAGGFNPGVEPGISVKSSYGPEQIDAFELGTKNTALDGTLQANADIWYYDYKGLQVAEIINNTSVNQNIDATLYGVEGEFIWAPDEHWQFNLNYANTHTSIGNASAVDTRNPSASNANALLVKDDTLGSSVGQNCVLYYNGAAPGSLPAGFTPGVGGVGALSGVGIPYSAYGSCMAPTTDMTAYGYPGMTYGQLLALQGFATSQPGGNGLYDGVPVSLKGHWLQNTPENTLSIGAQYSDTLPGNYHWIARVDYYWQSSMFGTIFNTAADKIPSWDVMNMQLTLNSPDDTWYAQAFIKNVMDNNNLTGMYVSSQSTGLFTNGFYGDPRTYGITLGVHL